MSLFQEEEDLVNAHRTQVEETMNIVREVLNCRCCFIFTFILRNLLMFLKIIEYDYSTESLTFFYEYHNQELCACFHQEH